MPAGTSARGLALAVLIATLAIAGGLVVYGARQDGTAPLPAAGATPAQVQALPSATEVQATPQPLPTASAGQRPVQAEATAATPGDADRITVSLAGMARTIPADFFGLNYVAFWDGAQGSAASARALSQTAIRTIRFPGGAPADWYDWQDPYYKKWSSTSPADLWRYARSSGAAHVVFGTNYQGHLPNPPGKPYAVNSPQNAAAWVRSNKGLGISADMEVGNEEDLHTLGKADDPGYAPYVAAFSRQARAMHAAVPAVRVLGPAGVNEYYWWALDGLGMFLRATGNRHGSGQVDGVSLHFYSGSTWYDARSKAQYWLSPRGPWAAIQRMIRANDTRNLPVYLTEWNLGASDSNNAFNGTLGHALSVADMLGALAQSGVAGEDYFSLHGASGWGLLYGPGESRPVDSPTPTYYTMALWSHMGHQLLPLSQTDDPASVMSTYATRGEDGSLQLLAINKERRPRTIHLLLDGGTPAGHHLRIYSLQPATGRVDDTDARYNGSTMPSPQRPLPGPLDGGLVSGDTLDYTVPAYSAVVLSLDGVSPAAPLTPTPTAGPNDTPVPVATTLPQLHVAVTGSVGQPAVRGGQTEDLTAAVRADDDTGPVLVDLEVYDSANSKVFQSTQVVSLLAGTPVTVAGHYKLATDAYSGTYYYKVGVFGLNWSSTYAWDGAAGRFSVAGKPIPRISITGAADPQQAAAGQAETLTATIAPGDAGLSKVLVDMEVYSPSGARVCQPVTRGLDVPPNGQRSVVAHCRIPPDQPAGIYVLKVGVFRASWSRLLAWTDKAATFAIGGLPNTPPGSGSNTPTPGG